jgi:formylmethanofuran dehydrogenase subunit B
MIRLVKSVLTLNTERRSLQGMYLEDKFSDKYFQVATVAEMNPDDARELGVKDRLKLLNNGVSVVVRVRVTDRVPRGTIFLLPTPWANALVSEETDGIGVPSFRDERMIAEPTDEPVTTLSEVLKLLGAKNLGIPYGTEMPLKDGERRVVENVVCTLCGEVCDYLRIELVGNRIVRNLGGCTKSNSKFLNYHKNRILKPYIRKDSKLVEVTLEEALDRAADILANSKYPLIYGLATTSNEAVEEAVRLAELVRGSVDNASTFCHGPTSLAFQEVGGVYTTFGDVVNLADLLIFWGADPVNSHINHITRIVTAKGVYVRGRKERKVVVIDVRRTELADMADLFIRVEPGRDLELITALRMAINELEIETDKAAGVSREDIYKLAEMMQTAKYGVIFYGLGLTENGAKYRNVQELFKLVQDLNEWTKFAVMPMRGHGNVVGGNEVMLWMTGFPYAIDFARGFPRMYVGMTTTMDLLMNGDVDAALIVGTDPAASFPRKALEHLSKIPVIVIDPKWSLTTAFADVIIPSGMTGIECGGSVYRMDKVPIKLKKFLDSPPGVLCDAEILKMLVNKVVQRKYGGAQS